MIKSGEEIAPGRAKAAVDPEVYPVDVVDVEPESSDEVSKRFEEAKAAAAKGRLEEALDLYRDVVASDARHIRARNNLAIVLDQMGNQDAALECLNGALELDPKNAEVMTNIGAVLAACGRFDEAEIELRKAAKLDPGGTEVRANLAFVYFRRGLYAEAEEELRKVCRDDPSHVTAHLYRGEALNRLGRIDDGIKVLNRAAVLRPGRPRTYYLLGMLYDKKGQPAEAVRMYRKATELERG